MYPIEFALFGDGGRIGIGFFAALQTREVHFLHREGSGAIELARGILGFRAEPDIVGVNGNLDVKHASAFVLAICGRKPGTPGYVAVPHGFFRMVRIGAVFLGILVGRLATYRGIVFENGDFGIRVILAILSRYRIGIFVTGIHAGLGVDFFLDSQAGTSGYGVGNAIVDDLVVLCEREYGPGLLEKASGDGRYGHGSLHFRTVGEFFRGAGEKAGIRGLRFGNVFHGRSGPRLPGDRGRRDSGIRCRSGGSESETFLGFHTGSDQSDAENDGHEDGCGDGVFALDNHDGGIAEVKNGKPVSELAVRCRLPDSPDAKDLLGDVAGFLGRGDDVLLCSTVDRKVGNRRRRIVQGKHDTRPIVRRRPVRPVLAVRRGVVRPVYPIGVDRGGRSVEIRKLGFPGELVSDTALRGTDARRTVDAPEVPRIDVPGFAEREGIVGHPGRSVHWIVDEGSVRRGVHVPVSELPVAVAPKAVHAAEVRRNETAVRSTTDDIEHVGNPEQARGRVVHKIRSRCLLRIRVESPALERVVGEDHAGMVRARANSTGVRNATDSGRCGHGKGSILSVPSLSPIVRPPALYAAARGQDARMVGSRADTHGIRDTGRGDGDIRTLKPSVSELSLVAESPALYASTSGKGTGMVVARGDFYRTRNAAHDDGRAAARIGRVPELASPSEPPAPYRPIRQNDARMHVSRSDLRGGGESEHADRSGRIVVAVVSELPLGIVPPAPYRASLDSTGMESPGCHAGCGGDTVLDFRYGLVDGYRADAGVVEAVGSGGQNWGIHGGVE